jgi:hypothetical protein
VHFAVHFAVPSLLSLVPAWTTAAVALQLLTHAAQSAYLPQDFQKPVPEVSERMKGLAMRVSNLAPSQCRRELAQQDKEKVFQKQGPTSGIATPLRIAGPVSGVTFQVPPAKFPYGRLDCRLALVILQMAPVLKSHGIESVRIDSFYRQGARLSGRRSKKSQHAYGLAIDLVSLRGRSANMTEAATLDVKEDFRGKRGETPCGPKARLHLPKAASADDVERAVLLRNVVCALGRSGMFHHILTPNYNQAHESHIHLDIKRDNKWFSLD